MELLSNIELYKDWKDITVEEYVELKRINKEELGVFGVMLERFCIIAGIDSDDDRIQDVPMQELNKHLSKLHFLNLEPSNQVQHKVEDKMLMPFGKLTLGAYIDLDYYLQDLVENTTKILAVFYRKFKIDEWGNTVFEPYTFDINKRAAEFEGMNIKELYASIPEFIKFRANVIEKYKFLFDTDEEGDLDEEETKGLTEADIQDLNAYLQKQEAKKKFSWQSLVYSLAGEDITKMKDVFETPVLMVFNILAMNKVMSSD